MNKRQVSVIMPTYNRAYIIQRSIKSVLKQTYTNWELIIIDDGSTDHTEALIKNVKDGRIRYIRLEQNQGACHARNCGLAAAQGEYIAFLDSDDIWERIYLENRISALENAGKNVGAVFGCTKVIRNNRFLLVFPSKDVAKKILHCRTNKVLIRQILFDNIIAPSAIVLKKECIDKIAGFNENLRRLQDWEYFFRILYYSGYKVKFTNDCFVRNYQRKDSITHRNNDEAYWESRIFFLKEYKAIFEEYGCFHEVVCQYCLRGDIYLSEGRLHDILGLLETEDIKRVVFLMKKEYEKLKKESKKLNNEYEKLLKQSLKGWDSASYLAEINRKDNLILSIQSKWIRLLQNGVKFDSLTAKMGYKRIAIYGYGYLGRALHQELSSEICQVVYIVDQYLEEENGIKILKPKENLQKIDAVVVTAVYDYEQIKKRYEKNIPYISLSTIIEFAEKQMNRGTII